MTTTTTRPNSTAAIRFNLFILSVCIFLFPPRHSFAKFVSSVDADLSIKKVLVLPLKDNLKGIYSNQLNAPFIEMLQSDNQWTISSVPSNEKTDLEDLLENAKTTKLILEKNKADAIVSGKMMKGPSGLKISLAIFAGAVGLPLAIQESEYINEFETKEIQNILLHQVQKLKEKIPYSGVVLSRSKASGKNTVTLNIGSYHNLRPEALVSVIQILQVKRHPKFKFVVDSEKEIIGRIRITKVEEYLSFGEIEFEREVNVVQPYMKLIPIQFVSYPKLQSNTTTQISGAEIKPEDPLRAEADKISYGQSPTHWVPAPQASFGKVDLQVGLGNYTLTNNLNTVGSLSATKTLFVPSIHLDTEIWITKNWFAQIGIRQYILSLSNPYPGSTPEQIQVSTMQTQVAGGYYLLTTDDFFGPKFQFTFGYSNFKSTVDDSTPKAFTSNTFSGLVIGLGGSMPVSEELPLTLGANLNYHWQPTFDETPVSTGGSSTSTVTSFNFWGTYRWSEHYHLKSQLMYDLFSASLSGAGTRSPNGTSVSHSLMTITAGIEYFF